MKRNGYIGIDELTKNPLRNFSFFSATNFSCLKTIDSLTTRINSSFSFHFWLIQNPLLLQWQYFMFSPNLFFANPFTVTNEQRSSFSKLSFHFKNSLKRL